MSKKDLVKVNLDKSKARMLVPVTIWYSVSNGGDGSAYPQWFLTEEETEYDQENMSEGWGETCNGSVETYMGSNIHKQAEQNSKEQAKERSGK